MSKKELKKINNEYKQLKSLELVIYFHFNKLKLSISFFLYPIIIIMTHLLFYSYKSIEIPLLIEDGYNPILTYSAFFISFALIIFILVSNLYINFYAFYKWIKNKEDIKFNNKNEYNEALKILKNKALELFSKLKKD